MKIRLDVRVQEEGNFTSREKARIAIMEGKVYVNGQKEDKPGTFISDDAKLEIRSDKMPYVSRGGYKLEKAMKLWPISLTGKTCMDVGASTGGFTDCMLQNGADKVYAIDVGYGQLAWSLRNHPKVINLEKTNARYLTREIIPDPIDFSSVDCSFISLTKILPVLWELLKDQGESVLLIKPQFEAGREKVGKKGVVRDPETHKEVILSVLAFTKELGFSVKGLTFSPIRGPEGNIEYLLYIRKDGESLNPYSEEEIKDLVKTSHENFQNEKTVSDEA